MRMQTLTQALRCLRACAQPRNGPFAGYRWIRCGRLEEAVPLARPAFAPEPQLDQGLWSRTSLSALRIGATTGFKKAATKITTKAYWLNRCERGGAMCWAIALVRVRA
jgi:hypothetical protein